MLENIKPYMYSLICKLESFVNNLNMAIVKLICETAIILLVCVLTLHWIDGKLHKQSAQTNAVVATASPIVKDEPVAQVEIKTPVKVFKNSHKIKQKAKLPESVIQNENAHVLTAISIDKDKFDKTVTTVLDTDTGITTSYVKNEPLPWLSLNLHGDVGLYGGIKNGTTAVRLQANQGIIDIKDIHIKATGSIDQNLNGKTDYFVGIGAAYNW
jgi:hypothetical protein